jgi:hypothetical protein
MTLNDRSQIEFGTRDCLSCAGRGLSRRASRAALAGALGTARVADARLLRPIRQSAVRLMISSRLSSGDRPAV